MSKAKEIILINIDAIIFFITDDNCSFNIVNMTDSLQENFRLQMNTENGYIYTCHICCLTSYWLIAIFMLLLKWQHVPSESHKIVLPLCNSGDSFVYLALLVY